MADEIVDVFVTHGDFDWLAGFVRRLVEDRLVACGNIVPGVRSVYRWEGEIQDDRENLVILHTRASLVPIIIDRANAEHSDDTPQVVAIPVTQSHPGYHRWLLDSTREQNSGD